MQTHSETNATTERIADAAEQARQTATEHPLMTLAFVGAAAFAVGALWKAGRRPSSRLDRMRAQMPDLDTLYRYMPKDYARYIPKEYRDYLPRALR